MAESAVDDRLVLIGGSSGSLESILKILPNLKRDFPIPILLVLHRQNTADDSLALLLNSKISMTVREADEKDKLTPGTVFIAPPDYHLLIEDDHTLSLDASEKVNYSRPSIDVSFTSAAGVYKKNLIAILLSGANSDGARGMKTIAAEGGHLIIQDPAEAMVSFMPEQAIIQTGTSNILTSGKIVEFLNALSS